MARVALVTGGTRGIGVAISQALQAEGCLVAATYAGNAEAAKAFASRTGISAHHWDIGDFDACATGVKAIEASVGPIDILVNNAGIVRDATEKAHDLYLDPEEWIKRAPSHEGSWWTEWTRFSRRAFRSARSGLLAGGRRGRGKRA